MIDFIGISEKWDLRPGTVWWDSRPDTQVLSYGWDLEPETQTLKMKPETQSLEHLFYMGSNTRDPGHWKKNLGRISCWTWDARTMIQMNLIKCPINKTWVIIFLIFNHVIKRLQQKTFFFYYKKFDLYIHKTYTFIFRRHWELNFFSRITVWISYCNLSLAV